MQRRARIAGILLLVSLFFVLPPTASALSRRNFGRTQSMAGTSTTGIFIDKQVWLPGRWTVKTGTGDLLFTRREKVRTIKVYLKYVPKDDCAYGLIRIRALKAWGGKSLNQSQARIQTIKLGTSKYRGYTWVEPTTWEGDRHWCLGQDLKHAVELSAPQGDKELITFITNDLLLQLAVRHGRSVLIQPRGFQSSSSSAP